MDLLPGPVEDAAVARVRPLLDAHLDPEAWSQRLRTDAPVAPIVVAQLIDAAVAATGITDAAVVAVEFGRALAPVEVLGAMVAGARAASAVARPEGAWTLLGPADGAVVVVWDDPVAIAGPAIDAQPRPCIDPTTPLAHATLPAPRPLDATASARAHLLATAYLAGLARGAQDLAVDYAKVRVQFDRPIGANQAVKHALADCATRTEAAWATVLYGATAAAEGAAERDFWLAAAARTAADAADANARTAIQVHGGRGYTLDCPAHLFLTRARLVTRLIGGVDRIRARLVAHAPDV